MDTTSKKPTSSDDGATNSEPTELPERWSAPRKTELMLRVLRGESLDSVSQGSQVPAKELESWTCAFLDAGMRGLKRHVEPEDRELIRTRAKIGELTMRFARTLPIVHNDRCPLLCQALRNAAPNSAGRPGDHSDFPGESFRHGIPPCSKNEHYG